MHLAPSLLSLTLFTTPHIIWSSDNSEERLQVQRQDIVICTDMHRFLPDATKNELFKLSLNRFCQHGLRESQGYCAQVTNFIRSLFCHTEQDNTSDELRPLLNNMAKFIEIGADPNIASQEGQVRIIHIVSGLGESEGITFLLGRRADPQLPDKFGHNAFHYAKRHLKYKKPEIYRNTINLLKNHRS